ncbi:MAG: hypothetical protein ACUVTM_05995 [Candidatus Bathyarchaeia archaeon]
MKFGLGKKQKVSNVDLDELFTDLKNILLKHHLIPAESIDILVSEWVNDILFIAGMMTEEDLREEMEVLQAGSSIGKKSTSDVEIDDTDQ